MASTQSILNIAGVPSNEFIEEVTDSKTIKKNEIFFAMLVDGLPGDPAFGLGISDLVGSLNTSKLKSDLNRKAAKQLPDLVSGISYEGLAVAQDVSNQFIGADFHFNDQDANDDILIPLAFPKVVQ
jgi:hypothetical protein